MISSISQALSSSTSGPTVNKAARSATGPIAQQIREAQESGGGSFDDSSLTATILELSTLPKPIEQFGEVRRGQNTEAGRSMETIKKELGKIDAMIAKRRPDLAGGWDFKLIEGKFKVTGLNASDAKWLETQLNENTSLKGAAELFMSTAVTNLQASSDNLPRVDYSYATRKMESFTFNDVKAQLEDRLSFRSLLTESDQIIDSNRITMEAADRGMSGLAVAANLLTPSNQPIERKGVFFSTSYGG